MYGKCLRHKYYNGFILIYSKESGYCVAVRECTVRVWEINIIFGFYVNL
jgi:hypothetical protein